jgi:hypothetical protein
MAVSRTDGPSIDVFVERLHQRFGVTLNAAQVQRLAWLAMHFGPPALWDGSGAWPKDVLVVVTAPPNALQIEFQRDRFREDMIVVIPCGECPAYDRLKSELIGFGTVGTAGAAGPHQFWWGGSTRQPLTGSATAHGAQSTAPCHEASAQSGTSWPLRPSPALMPVAGPGDRLTNAERILSAWEKSQRPVVSLDGFVYLAAGQIEMESIGCDFAVYKRDRWQFDTRCLYFGRRDAAEALLRTWAGLCLCFPGIDDGLLLDQAWCLSASQTPLDTFWLSARDDATTCDRSASRMLSDGDVSETADAWLDPLFMARVMKARAAERTGAPELLMSSGGESNDAADARVVIHVAPGDNPRVLALQVEALTGAFASDPAGFRRFELAICTSKDEVERVSRAGPAARTCVITSAHRPADDTFSRLAQAGGDIVYASSGDVVNLTDFRTLCRTPVIYRQSQTAGQSGPASDQPKPEVRRLFNSEQAL